MKPEPIMPTPTVSMSIFPYCFSGFEILAAIASPDGQAADRDQHDGNAKIQPKRQSIHRIGQNGQHQDADQHDADPHNPEWRNGVAAALLRPGYDEPWLVEEFDQLVLNGLAPSERDLWRIEPEQQEWVTLIDPHPDFVFTLEIMRLEGLGGTVIAATEWGDIEESRLALYNKTLEKIRSTNSLALDMPPR